MQRSQLYKIKPLELHKKKKQIMGSEKAIIFVFVFVLTTN